MYHHPGEYVTDFCLVKRDDQVHLFHIRGERWTWPLGYREIDLGHAVSTDMRHWVPLDPVLPAGPAGAWDACGIWAPDIIEVDDVYHLYYTGTDVKNNQKIGLATSRDLVNWTKHDGNPVVEPGAWSDRALGVDVAGRDAMVFAHSEDGAMTYLLYYTATMADGRACIALAQSDDLFRWRDLGPTYIEEDRSYNRLESAYVVEHGNRYYLFYSAKGGPNSKGFAPDDFDHFDIVYLVSDTPYGRWEQPPNHQLLAGTTCASEHPTFDDTTYMFYIIQEEIDGVWGASTLSDPKRVVWAEDGTVRIQRHLGAEAPEQVLFDSRSQGYDDWIAHGCKWHMSDDSDLRLESTTDDGAPGLLSHTRWGRDLTLEAEVQADGGSAALIVRGNPSGLAGHHFFLDFDKGTVGHRLRFPGRPDRLLQERPASSLRDGRQKLTLVVRGSFFELFLNDSLTLVRHNTLFEAGCFGLSSRGRVRFSNILATCPNRAKNMPQDWRRHCRPRHLVDNNP